RTVKGPPRELHTVRRVRAVAAEVEVAVEVSALQLDVRRGLHPAGGEPEEVALLAKPWQQLPHTGQHPVALRLRHRPREQRVAPREELRELPRGRRTSDHP